MEFHLIQKTAVPFVLDKEAFEGVKRVAETVCDDIKLVSGKRPKVVFADTADQKNCVVVGTVGQSRILDEYEKRGLLDLSEVRGKREVFRIAMLGSGEDCVLVIAGSDKRGTIYGMFELSEHIGVSPWVYFADVTPRKDKDPVVRESLLGTSKEPSVKYRGFFINDEWPSFGNWTVEKFGDFNAKMYEKVFELILRLKGNYLWPAMWSASFPLDGPGLGNAELADLYGVVMGTSHHEPCLRASEEWDKVKGPNSKYGQDWNYYINKKGLLNYWEDGLKRSGKFENIITIGMRGERDSSMLGPDATLGENIDLLKDIIAKQRGLIKKHVNKDLSKVPQMIALYKEVEAYYYGDATTPGLQDWDGLDGVTLMLCEDNFGNMRTLPTDRNRNHDGGFGMYYHFDYHGGPVSYEWINSTPLMKVCEQMSLAYDYGVRDIWIVNVGDLKPQELPLTYFMKLAYDFDSYGMHSEHPVERFLSSFVVNQFGPYFEEKDLKAISILLMEYTKRNGIRRPEVLTANVYHPAHFEEQTQVITKSIEMRELAESLRKKCPKACEAAFFELVYFPVAATMNLNLMQGFSCLSHFYAERGMMLANRCADLVEFTIAKDTLLTEEYHSVADGKWNHMMSSAHIGFRSWNDEGWRYPTTQRVFGVPGSRIGLRMFGEDRIAIGGRVNVKVAACGKELIGFLYSGGTKPAQVRFEATGDCSLGEKLPETVGDSETFGFLVAAGRAGEAGKVIVHTDNQRIEICVERVEPMVTKLTEVNGVATETVLGYGEYVAYEVDEFLTSSPCDGVEYKVLEHYGRTKDSAKPVPTTRSFTVKEAVSHKTAELSYKVKAAKAGEYAVEVYVSPTNPLYPGDEQRLALSVNGKKAEVFSTLPEGFLAGNCWNAQWNDNVLDNIRICKRTVKLAKGENVVTLGAVDAGVLVQKLVLHPVEVAIPKSYLGPITSEKNLHS